VLYRRVRKYQSGDQNPYIEEEQTTQWPKEIEQKDKQRSTKHTYQVLFDVNYIVPFFNKTALRCNSNRTLILT